jgi:hypothetical protein
MMPGDNAGWVILTNHRQHMVLDDPTEQQEESWQKRQD